MKYAAMLAERMERHGTRAWLVNTGWTGGRWAGRRASAAASSQPAS
jgi:phosphoenolpyruvate carboxykinase (ATP)